MHWCSKFLLKPIAVFLTCPSQDVKSKAVQLKITSSAVLRLIGPQLLQESIEEKMEPRKKNTFYYFN
jgi:hypothetical protein